LNANLKCEQRLDVNYHERSEVGLSANYDASIERRGSARRQLRQNRFVDVAVDHDGRERILLPLKTARDDPGVGRFRPEVLASRRTIAPAFLMVI
jgi:hypothetical protein